MAFLASDLTVRTKENASIPRDDWFLLPADERGSAAFSQRLPESISVQGLTVEATGLAHYSVR